MAVNKKPRARKPISEPAVKPEPVKKRKGCGCGGYRKRKKEK